MECNGKLVEAWVTQKLVYSCEWLYRDTASERHACVCVRIPALFGLLQNVVYLLHIVICIRMWYETAASNKTTNITSPSTVSTCLKYTINITTAIATKRMLPNGRGISCFCNCVDLCVIYTCVRCTNTNTMYCILSVCVCVYIDWYLCGTRNGWKLWMILRRIKRIFAWNRMIMVYAHKTIQKRY